MEIEVICSKIFSCFSSTTAKLNLDIRKNLHSNSTPTVSSGSYILYGGFIGTTLTLCILENIKNPTIFMLCYID